MTAIPASKLTGKALHDAFLLALKENGIPEPASEVEIDATRRWRMDYAWFVSKVALEVEGGVHTGGRHTRGVGFLKDMEKYNAAVIRGWRVVRTTPAQLASVETLDMLRALITQDGAPDVWPDEGN